MKIFLARKVLRFILYLFMVVGKLLVHTDAINHIIKVDSCKTMGTHLMIKANQYFKASLFASKISMVNKEGLKM